VSREARLVYEGESMGLELKWSALGRAECMAVVMIESALGR